MPQSASDLVLIEKQTLSHYENNAERFWRWH
jgi:hypothetical protein